MISFENLPSEKTPSWAAMGLLLGAAPLAAYQLLKRQSDRSEYVKMHRAVFGIDPLPFVPLHRLPIWWVRHELLFGWIDIMIAEARAAVYFELHPEHRKRWEYLAEKWGEGRHTRHEPLTFKQLAKEIVQETPRRVVEVARDVPRRVKFAWWLVTTGRLPAA